MKEHPLYYVMSLDEPIGYDPINKGKFEKAGKLFMQYLETLLRDSGYKKVKKGYNRGGIAVSGEHSIMALKNIDKGFALYISEPTHGMGEWAMARTIASLDDHKGGENVWIPNHQLKTPEVTLSWLESRFG